SALYIHGRISGFRAIQHLTLCENFLKEGVEAAKSLPHLDRGEDNEVHGKWAGVKKVADFSYPFCRTVSALHDDQQIKVAIGCGLAVGVGTEQDDILRAKRVNDLLSDLAQESWSDWRSCGFTIVSRFDALGIWFGGLQTISLSRFECLLIQLLSESEKANDHESQNRGSLKEE